MQIRLDQPGVFLGQGDSNGDRRPTDIIHLDLFKTFGSGPIWFGGWAIQWMKNWLDGCSHRIVVNGFLSTELSALLGLVLFNILFDDTDSGIECSLSKAGDDMKLSDEVNITDREGTIQRNLDKLEK